MLGGITASKCLCDELGHAEPDLLHFITSWQQVCSTESLTKVYCLLPLVLYLVIVTVRRLAYRLLYIASCQPCILVTCTVYPYMCSTSVLVLCNVYCHSFWALLLIMYVVNWRSTLFLLLLNPDLCHPALWENGSQCRMTCRLSVNTGPLAC